MRIKKGLKGEIQNAKMLDRLIKAFVQFSFLLACLSISILSYAQTQSSKRLVSLPGTPMPLVSSTGNSINYNQLWGDSSKTKKSCLNACAVPGIKLLFTFDSRNSFILNQNAKFFGLRFGLEFYDHYRVGFGWYFLRSPIALPDMVRPLDTLHQTLRFNYSTVFFEYVIYEDFKWEAVASIPFGRGTGVIDTVSTLFDERGTIRKQDVNVIAPSIGGHYKLFYWLGIGTGAGYRFVISPEKQVRKSLSAPFYVIKVKLFLGGIYKSIFKAQVVKEEKEAWKQERAERKQKRKGKRAQKNKK